MERKPHPSETKNSYIKKTESEATKFDWNGFLDYVNSYDPKKHGSDNPVTIQEDMIYGIGIYTRSDFNFATGYKKFKDILINRWSK